MSIILHLGLPIFLSRLCEALLASRLEPSYTFTNGKSYILYQLIYGLLKVNLCELVFKLCHLGLIFCVLLMFLSQTSDATLGNIEGAGSCQVVRILPSVLSFTHMLLFRLHKNLTYIHVSFSVGELWNACRRAYINWHLTFCNTWLNLSVSFCFWL